LRVHEHRHASCNHRENPKSFHKRKRRMTFDVLRARRILTD
jgi:hypothetical protein